MRNNERNNIFIGRKYKNKSLISLHYFVRFGYETLLEIQKASRIRLAFPSRQEHRIIEPDLGGVANNHLTK
jgi:hypothetical protein